MNLTLLRQVGILSSILGALLGIITLIPIIGNISFLTLMCLSSAIVILIMVHCELLDRLSVKESVSLGALIGFVSFIAFTKNLGNNQFTIDIFSRPCKSTSISLGLQHLSQQSY